MNSNFFPSISLARRATVPISPLAPAASMIDPHLEQYNINTMQQQQQQHHHQRMSRSSGPMSMQNPMQNSSGHLQSPMQSNSSHLQSPMQSSNAQQLQSPIQNNNHFQNAGGSHVRSSQNVIQERSLPSTQVNNHTIDEAYVQFIFFCNPSIPLETDTAELRRGFRAPPKSDGKTFNPYDLFTLIAKLEDKKDGIDNWTKLVLELGVEPPDQEKGQSSQKVQQYAVRLKRWLHAFHVDAFYGYLLGRSTSYQIDRPSASDDIAHTFRDGISPEDDLAIRALVPSYRPKRGRRKQEEAEAGADAESSSKRQNTRSSSAEFPNMFDDQASAAPGSAMPWNTPTSNDMWTAAQQAIAPKSPNPNQTPTTTGRIGGENVTRTTSQTPWRFNGTDTPTSSYPQSAITPRQSYSASPAFDEPRSAQPISSSKSPSRAKRRQAPAVSSAWPSSASGGSGKLRGRPPSNRSIQDGPFSTFPANPTSKEVPTVTVAASTTENNQESSTPEVQPNIQREVSPSSAPGTLNTQSTARKPSKLQLQVPAHSGGPVRLATPPQVLINGESSSQSSMGRLDRQSSAEFFSQLDEISEDDEGSRAEDEEAGSKEDWKRRALMLRKKLAEKEEELKAVKRRVLDAVM